VGWREGKCGGRSVGKKGDGKRKRAKALKKPLKGPEEVTGEEGTNKIEDRKE